MTKIAKKIKELEKLLNRRLDSSNRRDVGIMSWLYQGKTAKEVWLKYC